MTFACTGSHPWVLDDRRSGRVVVVGQEAMVYVFDKRELVEAGRWP